MKKDFNTGLRKGIEADRVKLTRRRKLLLREMGLAEDLDSTELAEKLHAQTFPDDAWSLDMLDLLRDSVHRRNRGEVGAGTRKNMEARLDELLARPPVYAKEDGGGTELDKLKKGIAKHRDHIFTFLTNPAVPPTNNDSKKALRPAKTKLKVSGCFRPESGAENYATVASVIQTAVKNGQNPFEVLRVIAALALA